ncbi:MULTISPECIES: type I-E CRISPR-associated protein Cse1/CasA [Actinoalloteichus]|uniref:CRISPR type I-E/ECOLI-associated protein CasA/Cse1 n=1 Tax=Actinoalloteichus fjordicus TaxID=1612552 RepID=A0AAC9LH25_9PSEU|nr:MULTISPECIES: type I-E CRISPR-associated protein Cse1/CasA [Actinoalloteichus]APU16637.1 CRISPR type I-E/ECOLI-associated protein CasA/Cse1 [Actinoalloteichus fjordicus]APU22703.1 CRISPR type I-E/ECOLI-associated protein CasA/Cse1 [Actinoalloteichus sp. GBA129-24]
MVFDLISEKWLPVVTTSGQTDEIGLATLFSSAGELRRLVGQTPTMTAALHRMVLALAHRALGPATEDDWAVLWRRGDLWTDDVRRYLRDDRERFDLFHPDRPFLQCRSLATREPSGIARLVPFRASGSNATLFDHTTAGDRLRLTPAEAARWLVTLQCYDPGGLKTAAFAGAARASERAPANNFGCVLVEGATLKETVLLNLLCYDPLAGEPPLTYADDCPNWEDPGSAQPRPDERHPRGWTDVLTWPARRVLLSTGDSAETPMVDGVVITPGTRLRSASADQQDERMAAFRRPIMRGTKRGRFELRPVKLEEQRGVWRHAEELLLPSDQRSSIDQSDRRRPAALDAIADRTDSGLLPDDAVYTLRVYGQQLDSKAAVVQFWQEESVPAPVALLRAGVGSARMGDVIGYSCRLADDVGFLLRRLDKGYREEFKATPPPELELSYWPHLTGPFHTFIVALGKAVAFVTGEREHTAVEAWRGAVAQIAHAAADRWVYGAARLGARELSMAGKHDGTFRHKLDERLALHRIEVSRFLRPEDGEMM